MTKSTRDKSKSHVTINMILAVHFQAFSMSPFAYLRAWGWRILGKRLRSRFQLAPLLARSANAYSLWINQNESRDDGNPKETQFPSIIALIDIPIDGRNEDILRTERSLKDANIPSFRIDAGRAPSFSNFINQIDWDTKPWFMPLRAGDRVARRTANAYSSEIKKTSVNSIINIIYSDDDIIDSKGNRKLPHFKPKWNSELFLNFDYLSESCIMRLSYDDICSVHSSEQWISSLTKSAALRGAPHHLSQVLHHRQRRYDPNIPKSSAISKCDWPFVSVIIPTKNRVDLLVKCINGIYATDYPNFEIIIIDNDSDDIDTLSFLSKFTGYNRTVFQFPGIFNYSAINNFAASKARGSVLCLLNNDVEIISAEWLKAMVVQAERPDVGAVGAKLLYPDGRVQHAGVALGIGNAAGHAHRFVKSEAEGYFHRHSLPQFASAVTAACLVVKKERFMSVGGFDEVNFEVAFNDVDLCMRLNQKGWQSFYEPRATLIHHESISRGFDRDVAGAARFSKELSALKKLWRTELIVDPYHHPELSRESEKFVIQL